MSCGACLGAGMAIEGDVVCPKLRSRSAFIAETMSLTGCCVPSAAGACMHVGSAVVVFAVVEPETMLSRRGLLIRCASKGRAEAEGSLSVEALFPPGSLAKRPALPFEA